MTGVVEEGGLRVDANSDQVILVGLHPSFVSSEKLVDLMSVKLQDVHVSHHQRPDEHFITGEDVCGGLLREVAGVLQYLEQTESHESSVELVLHPPLLIQSHQVEEVEVGDVTLLAHPGNAVVQGQAVDVNPLLIDIEVVLDVVEELQRMGGNYPARKYLSETELFRKN